jgi:hypothetical protein
VADVKDTPQDPQSPEPAGAAGPVEPKKPFQIAINRALYEFIVAVAGISQEIAPSSVADYAVTIQGLATKLRSAVQRLDIRTALHANLTIAAYCLLIFLASTPHYAEDEAAAAAAAQPEPSKNGDAPDADPASDPPSA